MKLRVYLFLLVAKVLFILWHSASSGKEVKLAAFNVQIFGLSKAKNQKIMHYLSKIIRRYDLILIQEVRDKSGLAIQNLLNEVNTYQKGRYAYKNPYKLVLGPRLGKSNSKEQYAFFYNPKKIRVLKTFLALDKKDIKFSAFERPPYVLHLETIDRRPFDFFVMGLHVAPSKVYKELTALYDVHQEVVRALGEKDTIIMGDLNADCRYLSGRKLETLDLWYRNEFYWPLGHGRDSTTQKTDCSYDHFITSGKISNSISRADVFYFDISYRLDEEFTRSVSDHYPIEMTLSI